MKAILATVLVLLPACSSAPATQNDNITIVWNRVEEPHRVCESLSGRKQFFHILGCSHWSGRVCSIYAPAPRSERDLQRFATLGHELMHCFDGNWHDQWGRMTVPPSAAAGGSSASRKSSSGTEP